MPVPYPQYIKRITYILKSYLFSFFSYLFKHLKRFESEDVCQPEIYSRTNSST